MSKGLLPAVFAHLRDLPNLAVEDALLNALPALDEATAEGAVEILLARARPHALKHLAAHYPTYSPSVRDRLASSTAALAGVIRDLMHAPTASARLAALDLIRASSDTSLAYLVAEALAADDAGVRARAAETLVEMVARHIESDLPQEDGAALAAYRARQAQLGEALGQAVRSWELHFRSDVLQAALWMVDVTADVLQSRLEGPRSHLVHAVRQILAGPGDARLAGFLWSALGIETVREAAAKAIENMNDPQILAALIGASGLLADPELRRGCERLRMLSWCQMDPRRLEGYSGRDLQRIANLVARSGIPIARKLDVLSRWIESTSPTLRQAGLWALVACEGDAVDPLLVTVSRGQDPALRAIAERELRRRRPGSALTATLGAGPGGVVPVEWPRLASSGPPPANRNHAFPSSAATGAKADRPGADPRSDPGSEYLESCRALLAAPRPLDRVRGLNAAQAAGLERELAGNILRLVHDPDGIVRATAVKRLGGLSSATTLGVLRSALADPEPRVQANAIEALETIPDERVASWIAAKLGAAEPRVRANAIKALLVRQGLSSGDAQAGPTAGDALLRMLEDPVRAVRLSALWVVEKLGLRSLAPDVIRIGREDPDAHVRRRANLCLTRLDRHSSPTRPSSPRYGASRP